MLSDKMLAALNDQVNMEFGAYYTYLSMSAYLESTGLSGFAAWMRTHSDEELAHAMMIYDFVHRRLARVTLQPIAGPKPEWESPLAAFEDALEHEKRVTASINTLVAMAREEKDFATDSFLQWFVDEQVEEEELVDSAIQKLKLVGNSGPALYALDKEMGAAATAEAAE